MEIFLGILLLLGAWFAFGLAFALWLGPKIKNRK